ncbi:hypothetical protein, partial [Acinetobacter baumannii]|uniref:hypothetical protein n=1 Tax=Acinetobacter baumannii TaxID=470 RepID=UPI001C090507
LGDPSTARVVPANVSEFANIFGLGHNFRRATIEVIPRARWPWDVLGYHGLPVTREIEARIPEIIAKLREARGRHRLVSGDDPYIP